MKTDRGEKKEKQNTWDHGGEILYYGKWRIIDYIVLARGLLRPKLHVAHTVK